MLLLAAASVIPARAAGIQENLLAGQQPCAAPDSLAGEGSEIRTRPPLAAATVATSMTYGPEAAGRDA